MSQESERMGALQAIVRKQLSSSAHDMDHVTRVYSLCLRLAEDESDVDMDILKAAALLHDIARTKEDQDHSGKTDHTILGAEMAGEILRGLGYSEEQIESINHCILAHRFRSRVEPRTKEAKILFDADKLDVLGAIGVARSYVIAGEQGEKIYSDIPVEDYVRDNLVGARPSGRIIDGSKHTPNLEFETKFQLIPEKLHTEKARQLARERLEYMRGFFERVRLEVKGQL